MQENIFTWTQNYCWLGTLSKCNELNYMSPNNVFPPYQPALEQKNQSRSSLTPEGDMMTSASISSSVTAHQLPCSVIRCRCRVLLMTEAWSRPGGCYQVAAGSQTAAEHCPTGSCNRLSCTDDWWAADSAAGMTMLTYPNNQQVHVYNTDTCTRQTVTTSRLLTCHTKPAMYTRPRRSTFKTETFHFFKLKTETETFQKTSRGRNVQDRDYIPEQNINRSHQIQGTWPHQ